ncbi:hypothetical protein PCE1_003169 [Barthelona sp. PCE]
MPRLRNFEDDLILASHPEGKIVFEEKSLRMYSTQEVENISFIDSAIEGHSFSGHVEGSYDLSERTVKYILSDEFVSIEDVYEMNDLVGHKIKFFKEITSDVHKELYVPFPFQIEHPDMFVRDFFPMQDEYFIFSIEDWNICETRSYLFNVITKQYRLVTDYEYQIIDFNSKSVFFLLSQGADTYYQYIFSKEDINEAKEPDLDEITGVINHSFVKCFNAECICFINGNETLEKMILVDCYRNSIDLIERFPQLKTIGMDSFTHFGLINLTQHLFTMVLLREEFLLTVIHIENDHLMMSSGDIGCQNPMCSHKKLINVNEIFFDEECIFYGHSNSSSVFGPLRFINANNEVINLSNLCRSMIFFNGILQFVEKFQTNYYLYLREKKIIIFKSNKKMKENDILCNDTVVFPAGDCFFVMATVKDSENLITARIHWERSQAAPIITNIPCGGTKLKGYMFGLPLSYSDDGVVTNYFLGEKKIFSTRNVYYGISYFTSFSNESASACIFCISLYFFKFSIDKHKVEIQKHVEFNANHQISRVYFNPYLMEETGYQLFVVQYIDENLRIRQYLYCLDWVSERFFEPILLYNEADLEGDRFYDFLGSEYMRMDSGIARISILNEIIEVIVIRNAEFPHRDHDQDLNLPSNIAQTSSYDDNTKTITLRTFNIDKDPHSTNPTVETFHLPSFLAEASVFEYYMPDYYEKWRNE